MSDLSRPCTRVLIVSHGHPEEAPGGGEQHAYDLFAYFKAREAVEPIFLFPRVLHPGEAPPATVVERYQQRPDEFCFPHAAAGHYTTQYNIFDDSRSYDAVFAQHVTDFLRTLAPDVVHFHHYYQVGFEFFQLVRRALPDSVLCLTLHDFKVLCPANGYLVRQHEPLPPPARGRKLCDKSTLARCRECCPERTSAELEGRERFVHASLAAIDLFVAPSRMLAALYQTWGIPQKHLFYNDYGSPYAHKRLDEVSVARDGQHSFGYFGRCTDYKGVDVLLEAFQIVAQRNICVPTLYINAPGVLDHPLTAALATAMLREQGDRVHVLGGYGRSDLAARMGLVGWVVVPSIWWENSPLVIQEAFAFGRPVICSNVGGMAEKVRHERDGLHFELGSPYDLAVTIERACTEPGLWRRLQDALPAVESIQACSERLLERYHEALLSKRA